MPLQVTGIRFVPAGTILPYTVDNIVLDLGDKCVAESEHGLQLAIVIVPPHPTDMDEEQHQLKPVLRKATVGDLERAEGYKRLAEDAMILFHRRVEETTLPMKPVGVDFTLDGRKAIFYFTADERVDFRSLVKYLASQLSTRIQMRQIGVRDEAKKLGGYGVCGQPLCCSTFLTEFLPISVRMVKEQDLTLNPSRISGVCGRLKCCLAYEVTLYKAIKGKLPRIGERYMTEEGPGRVTNVTIVGEAFEVVLEDSQKRLFVQLPDTEERNFQCKSGTCGNGAGCGSR
jgi:cell fate regulator YaaT (PSP1 superfamily)